MASKEIIIASFDVDSQCGFTPLCPTELPVPNGHTIVEALNGNFEYATYRVGSKDLHPTNALWHADKDHAVLSHFSPGPGDTGKVWDIAAQNIDVRWPVHCISGTKGSELLPGLPDPLEYDYFVYKGCEANCHPYGACYRDLHEHKSTGVIEWLKAKQVTEVLVGGLATDYCVKTTALQLARSGFHTVVNLESCRGVGQESSLLALSEFKAARDAGLPIYAITNILDYRYQSYLSKDYEPQLPR